MSRRLWGTVGAGLLLCATVLWPARASAQPTVLRLGLGPYQPTLTATTKTYEPLAAYLATTLKIQVQLFPADSWAGVSEALRTGHVDAALAGPFGYVLAHRASGAPAIAVLDYRGKPLYHAIMIANPATGITTLAQAKGHSFAFADPGSTSGYLIPLAYFQTHGINPKTYFSAVTFTGSHAANELAVATGRIAVATDFDRNRNTMIEGGRIAANATRIIWTSPPLPNDAFAVSTTVASDHAFVARLRAALLAIHGSHILPRGYTGFENTTDALYDPIRRAAHTVHVAGF